MILSSYAQPGRCVEMHPLFKRAFAHMRETDLYLLPPDRYPILGDELFVNIEQVEGKTRAQARLEAHRKYIDIQLVLDGTDEMGWKPLVDCLNPVSEHSEEKDIRFFHDAPASWIAVPEGYFCIFFPDDAHAPLAGSGLVKKAIYKVAVEPGGV